MYGTKGWLELFANKIGTRKSKKYFACDRCDGYLIKNKLLVMLFCANKCYKVHRRYSVVCIVLLAHSSACVKIFYLTNWISMML